MYWMVVLPVLAAALLFFAGATFHTSEYWAGVTFVIIAALLALVFFGESVYRNYHPDPDCSTGIGVGEYEVQLVGEREDDTVIVIAHGGDEDDPATECRLVDKRAFVEAPEYGTDTVTIRVVEGGSFKDIEVLN